MNEDTKKLEQQMERATAAGDRIDDTLDAETASLREGWLALGKLIEAAQKETAGPPELQYPAESEPSHRKKIVGPKVLAAIATVAVSLLVAAVATLSFVANRPDAVTDGPEIARAKHDVSPANVSTELVQSQNQNGGAHVDEFAWDSALDEEIAAAGQKMQRIQADWYASSDASSSIYHRMEQMRLELNDNTL